MRQSLLTSKVVVSIPINLHSRQEIASALFDKYGTSYLFMGRVFQATKINQSCVIDIRNWAPPTAKGNYPQGLHSTGCTLHDWAPPTARGDRALRSGFANRSNDAEIDSSAQIYLGSLEKTNNHQKVVLLSSCESGYDTCLKIAKFTRVFLDIGGIATTVESAGITHEKQKWLANYNSKDVFDIYSLFVALVEGDDNYHSCGMHNFGKADVSIDITEEVALAIYVMNVFNYYRLTESPILQEGHTFQPDIECPTYQIKWTEYDQYEADSLLYNSYGKWHLSRRGN